MDTLLPSDSLLYSSILVHPNVKNKWQTIILPNRIEIPKNGFWVAIEHLSKEEVSSFIVTPAPKFLKSGLVEIYVHKTKEAIKNCYCTRNHGEGWYILKNNKNVWYRSGYETRVVCYPIKIEVLE